MAGIRQVNKREKLIAVLNVSATVPPHAPVASAVIARAVAPRDGKVKGLVVAIAVAGTTPAGSADFKQAVRCRDAGAGGAGTTVITEDAVLGNWATDVLPAAGTRIVAAGLSAAAPLQAGDIIDIHYNETGTVGTAVRATFNIIGILYEAADHLDPTI